MQVPAYDPAPAGVHPYAYSGVVTLWKNTIAMSAELIIIVEDDEDDEDDQSETAGEGEEEEEEDATPDDEVSFIVYGSPCTHA